ISNSPGVRECHCLFTYDSAVYLFGGDIKWENSTVNSFFHKAKMPFTTSSIPWEVLDTTNAINTCDITCIVEPSLSLLLVIGGSKPLSYNGFQVYNFTSNIWNDALNLIDYPTKIGRIFQPRSVLIEPRVILIWGGLPYDSRFRFIYKLNMTVNPWKWEQIDQNAS
ncbi:24533_t:CDS:1, partial [Dentiscutata erythropus]